MEQLHIYTQRLTDWAAAFTPKLIGALLALVIGFWIIGKIERLLGAALQRRKVDPSLHGFLRSIVGVGLKIVLIISCAGMVGFQSSSLVAIIGAAGLAVGLALQGSLANFAGGVLILMFKPYKVGDLVSVQGNTGHVREIQIFNTILETPDGKIVIIPNAKSSNDTIINLSRTGALRVDLTVKIAFDEDFNKVKALIMHVLQGDPKVLKTPAPDVTILEYQEGALVLAVRPYATDTGYWDVYFNAYSRIQEAFVQHNVNGPRITRIISQG